jgi:hypothetical protein
MPLPLIPVVIGLVSAAGAAAGKQYAKSRSERLKERIGAVALRRDALAARLRADLEKSREAQRQASAAALSEIDLRLERFGGTPEPSSGGADPTVAEALAVLPAFSLDIATVGDHAIPIDQATRDQFAYAGSTFAPPGMMLAVVGKVAFDYVRSAYFDVKSVIETEAGVEKAERETSDLETRLPELIKLPIAKYERTVTKCIALAGEWTARFDGKGLHMALASGLDQEGETILATLRLIRRFIEDARDVKMREW